MLIHPYHNHKGKTRKTDAYKKDNVCSVPQNFQNTTQRSRTRKKKHKHHRYLNQEQDKNTLHSSLSHSLLLSTTFAASASSASTRSFSSGGGTPGFLRWRSWGLQHLGWRDRLATSLSVPWNIVLELFLFLLDGWQSFLRSGLPLPTTASSSFPTRRRGFATDTGGLAA